MTLLIIKMIFIIPFLIFGLLCTLLANLLNKVPYIFMPLVYVLYKFSNFIMNWMIKDLVHSAKGTPLEKFITNIVEKEEI